MRFVPNWLSRLVQKVKKTKNMKTKHLAGGKRTPTLEQIETFWKEYDAGGRRGETEEQFQERRSRQRKNENWRERKSWRPTWFDQSGGKKREPLIVTSRLLGTVRNFEDERHLNDFLKRVNYFNEEGAKLKTANFVPIRILHVDFQKKRLVENVGMGPTVNDLAQYYNHLEEYSRYGRQFKRKMREKRVHYPTLMKDIDRTMKELKRIADKFEKSHFFYIDLFGVNVVVLDYDPKTRKPTVMVVDHGGSEIT